MDAGQWFETASLPSILLVFTAVVSAIAVLIVSPFVQLRISSKQIELGNRQAGIAERQLALVERQAGGSEMSARAALLSAENAGRHSVARFRQEWINALRKDLSELHSIIHGSSRNPVPNADLKKLVELRTQIQLMLNPEEKNSDDLIGIIDDMIPPVSDGFDVGELEILFVAKSQEILKTEWDRVKLELQSKQA